MTPAQSEYFTAPKRAASLDSRIAAAAPAVPFLGDFPHYAQIVNWPMGEILAEAKRLEIPEEELYRTLSYFDVKNFTDRIKCPIYMSFGLQDPTCPPHTEFAEYNQVKSSKQYFCVPLCGHAMWLEKSWTKKTHGVVRQLSLPKISRGRSGGARLRLRHRMRSPGERLFDNQIEGGEVTVT